MKIKLQRTNNYELFEMHECNRDLHDNQVLKESMRQHGFMPSSPLHCKRNGNGTLKVIRGHHRLYCAKELKIPVYYIIDESNCDIFSLEGGSGQNWSVVDFATARAKDGDKNCASLIAFKKKHGLPIGAAASLVGGESAGSQNKNSQVKEGTFHSGDMKHANAVVRITDFCRDAGMAFATSFGFVSAISSALYVPEFDGEKFLAHAALYPRMMSRRARTVDYMQEVEMLYNYGARGKRLPLAICAREIGAERHKTFGKTTTRTR